VIDARHDFTMSRFPIPRFLLVPARRSFQEQVGSSSIPSLYSSIISIFNFQSSFLFKFCAGFISLGFTGGCLFLIPSFCAMLSYLTILESFLRDLLCHLNGEGRRLHFIDPLLHFSLSHGHFYFALCFFFPL